MATQAAVFTPDYAGSLATGLVGTISTTASSGAITVGARRVIRIFLMNQTTPANPCVLRFTLGAGTAATPVSTSPFVHSEQVLEFDMGDTNNTINFANLAADNGSVTVAYAILPLSRQG